MHSLKTPFYTCALLIFLTNGCGLFNPQEPETYADLEINVRFSETNGNEALSSAPGQAKENWLEKAQALDRFVVTVFSYTPQLEEVGRELVRRELFAGEDRRLSAAVRVPLPPAAENYFIAEVQAFQRLDLIYSGSDIFQFDETTKTATVSILLQPVAFFASFVPQPNLPRFVLGQASALDTTITTFDFEGNGVGVTVTLGRANQASNAILLWGDTTIVKARARQSSVFRGEVTRRLSYTGVPADVLIACTWNQPVNFNLEIINPLGQSISDSLPGDVPNGSGVMLLTGAAYGPEVFEWRVGRITLGQFIVNVVRQDANAIGSGTVHVIRREGLAGQAIDMIPFEFRLTDTQNTKQVFSFTWQ